MHYVYDTLTFAVLKAKDAAEAYRAMDTLEESDKENGSFYVGRYEVREA